MEVEELAKLINRVGGLAMLHDPTVDEWDPPYDPAAEIEACLNEAPGLTASDRERLRPLIGLVLEDPTEFREVLCSALYGLDATTAG